MWCIARWTYIFAVFFLVFLVLLFSVLVVVIAVAGDSGHRTAAAVLSGCWLSSAWEWDQRRYILECNGCH